MLEDFAYEHPMIVLIGAIILATALIVGCVTVPAYYAQEHSCAKKAGVMQSEFQYGFWEGCWVKKDGSWVEYNTIRNNTVYTP